jgi:5-methylcytosine-specific restriction enzyme subunit McrC
MAAPAPVLEPIYEGQPGLSIRRAVYPGEEQGEIPIPLDCVFRGNALDIYPDVLNQNFFRLHLKSDRIIFQAAGFLGLIPLNDKVAIEVRSRVPIGNLERILHVASPYAAKVLPLHKRSFGFAESPTPSLIDLLSIRLLELVDQLRSEGQHYEYENKTSRGEMPHGRIMPFASASYRARTGAQVDVIYSAFERSYDTAPNRCLRMALRKLRDIYRGMRNRPGARSIASRLARAEENFSHAKVDYALRFLTSPSVIDPTRLAESKQAYSPAIDLAKSILSMKGINVRSRDREMVLPSVLINMEDVFEQYFRTFTKLELIRNGFFVLDGNASAPSGASRPLFDPVDGISKEARAKPDVVINRSSVPGITELIIDAKYKPPGTQPEREDLNQLLVYSVVYRCGRVALAYPRRKVSEAPVQKVGTISGVEIFKILVDLNAADLAGEEANVSRAVRNILPL